MNPTAHGTYLTHFVLSTVDLCPGSTLEYVPWAVYYYFWVIRETHNYNLNVCTSLQIIQVRQISLRRSCVIDSTTLVEESTKHTIELNHTRKIVCDRLDWNRVLLLIICNRSLTFMGMENKINLGKSQSGVCPFFNVTDLTKLRHYGDYH